MKKDMLRSILVGVIVLAVYCLIVFLIPFVKNATFWISFLFTLISFCVVAASVYIAFVKKPDAKSKFYGFPIARIGTVYSIVQLIAGLVFMVLSQWIPVWVAVLVYAIALGAAIIGLISADTVVDEIQKQDVKLKKNISMMRNLQSKLNQVAIDSGDPALKKLAEDIRYSDPVSSDALSEIEAELSASVDELQVAVVDGDTEAARQLCRKTSAILAERNRLCKLNK